jgi:hypothetical protein
VHLQKLDKGYEIDTGLAVEYVCALDCAVNYLQRERRRAFEDHRSSYEENITLQLLYRVYSASWDEATRRSFVQYCQADWLGDTYMSKNGLRLKPVSNY